MRKIFIKSFFFLFILLVASCDSNSPSVELKNNKVYLHNFRYVTGIEGPSSVTTNADEFDELIWDEFRNKTGAYDLVYIYTKKDKYGEESNSEVFFGKINLSELNKYQSLEDFKRNDGFFKIIER
ncbi:hypothetical protein LV84_02276 [Algoriphagus ratkowskyi]|uniref:Lipoprotein n=1 Tax=Algoriphagus ratkowskyi TaxID=57028 RepID=A0A2W7R622_9BACT|nr:hypothetical protein [Algoriphagus ratkowskyi]PZX55914.1 hypothetical protein LV84_02276 [Algoriphagus ratkowskyi]TXD77266.1 hypothetical protein ESW18_13315 [Algoriphagus ratkowskyi]